MKHGYLSEYFTGVAAKRLSAVEVDGFRSHQHEFNGVGSLKRILGEEKRKFPSSFIYLDDDDEPVISEASMTWYDAREAHPTRSEYRLYFPTTEVSECAAEGDVLVLGRRPDGSLLVVIAQGESTIANQVLWLFGLSDISHPGFSVREELESDQDRIEFAARAILETIGIEIEDRDESYLDQMLERFGGKFPGTKVFSRYARETLPELDPKDDPDCVLVAWLDREEILFRTLERYILAERLRQGFGDNVDEFIQFSLSVQNRRKSRAGHALENHLEEIFRVLGIRYTKGGITENRSRPDFLFPGIEEYRNPSVEDRLLTMLGAKSTCKDRWRQVLSEAAKIKEKHLLTLETAISTAQTDEMRAHFLQLVVPKPLTETYTPEQQSWLIDLEAFCELVMHRQHQIYAKA